jgi:DNA-binding transcriptional regulator GbsR (MarR family)
MKKADQRIREAQGEKSRRTAEVNAIRVLLAVIDTPLTFSELVKVTGFSKPVVAKHLKTWMNRDAPSIYKDTIKPGETANPKDIGKTVYRPYREKTMLDISTAVTRTLQMPDLDWSEEAKTKMRWHSYEIAKIILKEWHRLQEIKRSKSETAPTV